MLKTLGFSSLDALIDATVPAEDPAGRGTRSTEGTDGARGPYLFRALAAKEPGLPILHRHGVLDCVTPPVIQRNIIENPGWYTVVYANQPKSRRDGWKRCSISRR